MTDEVIQKIRSSGRLIIIDEAENLPYKALELIRRIHDKTEVGVLLIGMPALVENLRGNKNQYQQLYSRVGVSKKLEELTLSDVDSILQATSHDIKLSESYLEHSKGNTRVLSKLIMRAARVANINKIELTEKTIAETAEMLIV